MKYTEKEGLQVAQLKINIFSILIKSSLEIAKELLQKILNNRQKSHVGIGLVDSLEKLFRTHFRKEKLCDRIP